MSDFYRRNPNEEPMWEEGQDGMAPGNDPLAAYDDPNAMPPITQEDFSAWRRPPEVPTPSFLTDEPALYGAEMQQSGVPLYAQGMGINAEDDFLLQGSDAPTRIARPIAAQQLVNKRKTVDRGERIAPPPVEFAPIKVEEEPQAQPPVEEPAQKEEPVRRRRAGRVARYQTEDSIQLDLGQEEATEPSWTPPVPRTPVQAFVPPVEEEEAYDPFRAGDEETVAPEESRAVRRPAVPGERYTGPRTAVPANRANPPQPRPKQAAASMEEQTEQGVPQRANPARPQGARPQQPRQGERQMPQQGQRPVTGQRPQGATRPQGGQAPAGQRPTQGANAPYPQRFQGQRPMQGEMPRRQAEGAESPAYQRRQMPAQRPPVDAGEESERQLPVRRKPGMRDDASLRRPPYDFEKEEEQEITRRAGFLMPLVITLLVLGVLLAGVCLPNWEAMGGGIGGALGGVKSAIVGVFNSVKGLIVPEDHKVVSFAATPAEATAPADLLFTVQTSPGVTELRVVNAAGGTVVEKVLTDADTLNGEVTKNSNVMIWNLRYRAQEAYDGFYTVQCRGKDGAWNVENALTAKVLIAPPPVEVPPVQNFSCDNATGNVPASLGFTAVTSGEVSAVRVVDEYDAVVAVMPRIEAEADGSVTENGDMLVWELNATVEDAYAGNYVLQYQKEGDLSFTPSEYVVGANLTEEQPQQQPQAQDGPDDGPEVQPTPKPEPTSTPEPTPEPTATPKPEPTKLPALSAQAAEAAAPTAIGLTQTVYQEMKTTSSYSRTKAVSMLDPFNYAVWKQSGVLTFRGGPLRQNAAYGTADVSENKLSEAWKVPVGSKKLSKSTVYGVAWPGQPAIVKWPTEIRNLMNLNKEKKETTALKEVIMGGQDGLIYFLDLNDGQPTRDPLDMGAPIGGGISVATNGTPILGVGQSHSNLSGKQVDNGYHFINLLDGKELLLLDGRDKSKNSNYSGASGAALFDKQTATAVVGGQNGVLYVVELNETFDHLAGKLSVAPAIQRYKTLATKQDKRNTNIDGSVAMYNNYVFYADQTGVLQCLDINTLTPVWAVKTGDNVDATPALDVQSDGETLALYTGNTIVNQGKSGVCTLRRFDALTGAMDWEYVVEGITYTTKDSAGLVASPLVGEKAIEDLVVFTVTNPEKDSKVIALRKDSGSVAWELALESPSVVSPVAVYNEDGDAWIVQGESNGKLHLIEAKTGKIVNTLQLEGVLEGSPAVYRNMLVIGTTGKDTSYIYGIQIQ